MKLKKHLILLLTAIAMISCVDNQTDNYRINSYPMTIGSTWVFGRTIINNYYKSPTSDSIVSSDTMVFQGTTRIEKDTIINKSKVMVFKSEENDIARTVTTANYQLIDNEGLKLQANSYSGYMLYDYSNKTIIKKAFHVSTNGKTNSKSLVNSGVFVYSKPILSIKYPLNATSEWTSVYTLKIDKKVIGIDTLHINGHEYVCFKILWKYPEGYTIKVTEWIAKEGILKRETNFGTIYTTDEQGIKLNKFVSTECMIVKSVSIK